jgi:F-type H+-transporting ATPase subunit b
MTAALFVLAAEAPNGKFLPGDIKEFYWGSISFVIVFGLLAWKVFPLVGKALGDKANRIEAELSAAEEAQTQADAEAQALLAKLGDADADATAVVTEARATAAKLEADAAAKADADAEALKVRVAAELDAARGQATVELRAEMSKQALAAAEAVVGDNLDDATQISLIEQYISQVGASS